MELITLKDFAKDQNISYEAVRKQVVRYAEELSGHIVKRNRTQYIDDYAIKFLKEKRRESPIIVQNIDQAEEIEDLKSQVESLRGQLMTAQNELLKAKDQIIGLQEESKELLEDKAKYNLLLEDSTAKEEQLKELTKERDEARTEAQSFKKSIFGFYRKV